MPEARRGAARQSLHSVLYSSPAWSPEQHELNASPAALPPRLDIHPRFAQVRTRARTHRENQAAECAPRGRSSKTVRVCGRADNEYQLAACLLAFGSVTFTASSQAIHRKTK